MSVTAKVSMSTMYCRLLQVCATISIDTNVKKNRTVLCVTACKYLLYFIPLLWSHILQNKWFSTLQNSMPNHCLEKQQNFRLQKDIE